jgi:hypothetical protein
LIFWAEGESVSECRKTLSSAKEQSAARKLAIEHFQRFPKDRYQTQIESWRLLKSANIEFTMKRLREPLQGAEGEGEMTHRKRHGQELGS